MAGIVRQESELVCVGAPLTLRNRSFQMADAKRYAIKECQHSNILWLNHKAKLFFTLGFYQRRFECCSSWTWLLYISLQCPHYCYAHFKRRPINLLSMRGWDSGPSLPLRMSTHLTDAQSIPQIVANHHYWLLKQWLSLSPLCFEKDTGGSAGFSYGGLTLESGFKN